MKGDWAMRLLPSWEFRHPQLFARVRVVAAVWWLVLTAILYGYGRGGLWGVLLVPSAVVALYAAYRLPRAISARTNSARFRVKFEGRGVTAAR